MKTRFPLLLIAATLVGCGAPATSEPVAKVEKATVTPLKVTPVAYSESGDPVVEFEAPGMHCEACAASIVTALKEKKSVVDVTADAETKIVSVTFSQEGFDPEASMAAGEAVAAIADAGFGKATVVEEVEASAPAEEPTADNAG